LSEKDKTIEKLIEDKEKKNLENSKLYLQLNAKSEFEVLRREMEEYKTKIMCRCGADREREVVLKTCPHIFCKKCIDDTTANRNRKCPICSVRFTKTDIHEIVWT
jgi:E3 ubiquitin-protein ligase BRE1